MEGRMEGEDSRRPPPETEDQLRPKLELGQGESQDAAVLNGEIPGTTTIGIFPLPPPIGTEGIPPNLSLESTRKLKSSTKKWSFDENKNYARIKKSKNFRFITTDSEAGSSEDEEEKLYGKYLEPKPSKWEKRTPFLSYLFFWERRRMVRFPSAVVEKAESDQRLGETMGRFREVPRISKHREKLSSLLVSDSGGLHGEGFREGDLKKYRISQSTLPYPPDWGSWLIRDDTSNYKCCCGKKGTKNARRKSGFTQAEEKREPPLIYSDKFKVTEQKFGKTLDVIEEFTVGNLKTINYTLGVIGFVPFPLPGGAKGDEEEDEMGRFNHVAAGVWFFVFAIEELFGNEGDKPTQSEFRELMVEFANFVGTVDRVARRTVIFSKLHSAFGETAMTRLLSATNRLHVHSPIMDEFKIKPPAKLGYALQILPQNTPKIAEASTSGQSPQAAPPSFKLTTRPWFPTPKPPSQNPWLLFSRQSKWFKLDYLREFLTKLQDRMATINVQMRFLTDDILERNSSTTVGGKVRKSGKSVKDQSFLSALYSLDVVMYRFSVFSETTPKYERALMETMKAVTTDTYEVISKGEKIIESIIEVRDMVELGLTYMMEVYGIDFEELIPKDLNSKKGGGIGCCSCWKKFCCSFSDDPYVEPSPGFDSSDFFNTIYPFYLQKKAMVQEKTEYEFALKPAEAGEKKRAGRIVFPPTEGSAEGGHGGGSVQSNLTLEPPVGVGSFWDKLSQVDVTELKEKVLSSTPDPTDIPHLTIPTEIKRKETPNKGNGGGNHR